MSNDVRLVKVLNRYNVWEGKRLVGEYATRKEAEQVQYALITGKRYEGR